MKRNGILADLCLIFCGFIFIIVMLICWMGEKVYNLFINLLFKKHSNKNNSISN